MSEECSDLLEALENSVLAAQRRWVCHQQLFAQDKERQLLRKYFSTFYDDFYESFTDDLFMRICRLVDPAHSMNSNDKANLSFAYAIKQVDALTAIDMNASTKPHLEKMKCASKEMRRHRHKRIGHSDKNTRLGTTKPLYKVCHEDIEDFFSAANECLTILSNSIGRRHWTLDEVVNRSNARQLLHFLKLFDALTPDILSTPALYNRWIEVSYNLTQNDDSNAEIG